MIVENARSPYHSLQQRTWLLCTLYFIRSREKFNSIAYRLINFVSFTMNSQCWKDVFPYDHIDSIVNSFD